mgnify:CR=1 FL=1
MINRYMRGNYVYWPIYIGDVKMITGMNVVLNSNEIEAVNSVVHGRKNLVNITGFDLHIEVPEKGIVLLKSMTSGKDRNVPMIKWETSNSQDGLVKTCRPDGVLNLPLNISGIGYIVPKEVALYLFLTNSPVSVYYVDRYRKQGDMRVYDKIYTLG